ncbi:3-oxoacyl-[acyl-carrier-protein] reductase FabG-like [Dioscorea cayenensis subsp. rotundata]|uniref:3-oxoacyl-[acyl-carrier-protein] reductase FabG-like n=1 Tax=Dioscorea cayennensis subsp. rotundata TaxID=55577 RepID=A0AB40CPT4_DIOCR|nr:3-oxoacyl-[acyl-carrier-protein] reductase FabG-like [Dioscorea cayenensis subsp. rotundata]
MAGMQRQPWEKLEGKVVMVTGASSGIGRELCLDLTRAGCLIVAAARRTDRLRSLCDQINGAESAEGDRETKAVRSVAVELDLCGKSTEIEAAVQKAWDAFGRIDALVNNAGIRGWVYSPLDWSEEDWNSNIKTNLTGLWLVSKHVCTRMRDAKQKGSVINISSIAALDRGQGPGALAYCASKAGVNMVTKVMALELGVYNIRVNALAPGLFKSEITQGLMRKEWVNKVAEKIVPLKTFGTSDPALTRVVRYLIHDLSEYVTGNIFIVDAGATLPGFPLFSSL